MFFLDDPAKSLQALTGEAIVTSNLTYVVVYNQVSADITQENRPYCVDGSVTAVAAAIVGAPAVDVSYNIRTIAINNADTVSHSVIVRLLSSGAPRILFKATIEAGGTLHYFNEKGWSILDAEGRSICCGTDRVHTVSSPGAALTDVVTVATNKRAKIRIVVCNIANNNKNFRVAISPLGAAIANSHYIYYDAIVKGNETRELDGPYELQETDVVRVYGSDANVSFTINGISDNK